MSKLAILNLAFACGVLSAPTAAYADDYIFITKEEDGNALFLHFDTIMWGDDVRAVWLVSVAMDKAQLIYSHYLLRKEIRCSTLQSRDTGMTIYDASDEVLNSDDRGNEQFYIEPGTVDQVLYKAVCKADPSDLGSKIEARTPLELAVKFRAGVASLGQ